MNSGHCPECGADVDSDDSYCMYCGTAVGDVGDDASRGGGRGVVPDTCPECGADVDPGDSYCMYCGTAVGDGGDDESGPEVGTGSGREPRGATGRATGRAGVSRPPDRRTGASEAGEGGTRRAAQGPADGHDRSGGGAAGGDERRTERGQPTDGRREVGSESGRGQRRGTERGGSTQHRSGADAEAGHGRLRTAGSGAGSGVVVSGLFGLLGVQPVLAILLGAVATLVVLRRYDPLRPYAMAGTAYTVGFGFLIAVLPVFPPAYHRTALISLVGIGVVSALVVLLRDAVRRLVERLVAGFVGSDQTAERAGNTAAAVVGTLALAWSIVKAKERIPRTITFGILGPVAFLFELAGVELPWLLTEGFDVMTFLFVGSVVVGFHTFSSWQAALRLKDDEHVRAAGSRTKERARAAGERTKDVAETARDALNGSGSPEGARERFEETSAAAEGARDSLRSSFGTARDSVEDRVDGLRDDDSSR